MKTGETLSGSLKDDHGKKNEVPSSLSNGCSKKGNESKTSY